MAVKMTQEEVNELVKKALEHQKKYGFPAKRSKYKAFAEKIKLEKEY